MRFRDLFHRSLRSLRTRGGGTDGGRELEVELLIGEAFRLDRVQFWMRQQEQIRDPESMKRFQRRFARLRGGEPVSYILGRKEFYSRSFIVGRGALIPRPETELLVETALGRIANRERVLEIGAGSGIVAVTLALESRCRVTAVEKSRRALAVLEKNIAAFGLETRVTARQADLFPPGRGRFDLIVANPPYLAEAEWRNLPASIRKHEPKMALVAGRRGTEVIDRILRLAPARLSPTGAVILEIGFGQRPEIEILLRRSSFLGWQWIRDLRGFDRVLLARL